MKKLILSLVMLLLVLCLSAKSAEDYIKAAYDIEQSDIFAAIDIMEEANKSYPDNVDILSVYGLMMSKGSGQANFLKAGGMVTKAEKIFAQALEIQKDHTNSLLWRGILRVNVPKFFNKLDKGIKDLERIAQLPGLDNDLYLVTNYYLAFGYQRQGETEKAIENYKNIIRYGRNSEFYQDSLNQLQELTNKSSDELLSGDKLEAQADFDLENGDYLKAYEKLTEATKVDTSNLELHLQYLNVIRIVSEDSYDEKIYDDVAFMTDLAFNVAYTLKRIVILMPQNEDFRLLKAEVLSQLPFFVKPLDDAKEEIHWILNMSKNQNNRERAKEIASRITERENRLQLTDHYLATQNNMEKDKIISQMQFENTEAVKPSATSSKITLSLGFGDYIAPQTAVWIEDIAGNYIATVYVSAFSANIKEKQIHLTSWANKSNFEESIMKVSSASIDSGKHILYWNNKDINGNLLENGDFLVCAEVSHWPHANYSLQKVKLQLGEKNYQNEKQGDFIISSLKVEY